MLTAQGFREMVARTHDRMLDSQRQAVRAAIKAGSKAISCGRYYDGGPLVLTVTKPLGWVGEVWASRDRMDCIVPEGREEATLAWAARNPA